MEHKYSKRKVSDLIPYANNSRTHSDEQINQVASSIKEFGFTNPILIDNDGGIIAGHGRVLAAKKLKLTEVPCIELQGLTDAQKKAYVIADNQLALNAGWDIDALKLEIESLVEVDFDIDLLGFEDDFISGLLVDETEGLTDEDAVPDAPEIPVTVEGDVWVLGRHRLMCGDSTSIDAVERLMDGQKAQLLHADPPYGMGKEGDGVANDNLYAEKLDAFQMEWWTTFRIFIEDNASAYIWGNAPELWRLWYKGGLGESEHMELRNEIVWDKKAVPGMKSDLLTQFPEASERCLFFQIGSQFIGNVNSDDFPEEWLPTLSYFETEAEAAGITAADIKRVCGVQMFSHWFTKAQYNLMPRKHYDVLGKEYTGRFKRDWAGLKREWDRVKSGPTSVVQESRSYFSNGHDVMRDVWEFSRVTGEERHTHATPKPVEMMERVMKSSVKKGGICAEPFGGSGATLMGAEKTGRLCYTMELQPKYCDVIINRWQDFTGEEATHEDGRAFNSISINIDTEGD
mgnify:CR=1 FL=1